MSYAQHKIQLNEGSKRKFEVVLIDNLRSSYGSLKFTKHTQYKQEYIKGGEYQTVHIPKVGKVTWLACDEYTVLLRILGSILRRCGVLIRLDAHDCDIDSPFKKQAILTYIYGIDCLCNCTRTACADGVCTKACKV